MNSQELRRVTLGKLEAEIETEKQALARDFGSDLAGLRKRQGYILGLEIARTKLDEAMRDVHGERPGVPAPPVIPPYAA